MSSTTASATCTIVSVLRVTLRSRLALALRPPAFSASASRTRLHFSTGSAPNMRPAATESRNVNAIVVASTPIRSRRGSLAGARLGAGPQGEGGQAQADNAAEQAEQETLDQHLARQATAAAPIAARTASSCERPSVRTSNRLATFAHAISRTMPIVAITTHRLLPSVSDEIVDERTHLGRKACVFHHLEGHPLGRRELAEGDADHARHVGVDPGDVHARTHPANGLEVVASQPDSGPVEAQRQHEIVRRIHEPETLREHADDLARRAVHGDQPPDDARVASELALPVAVAQHHHFGAAVLIVPLRERPADQRLDAEERQEAMGRAQRVEALGLGESGDGDGAAVPDRDVGQRPRLLPVRDVVGNRRVEVVDVDAGRRLPEAHQTVGIAERQRLQEHGVDDAEDGHIRADPQGQGEHGRQREHRRTGQPAGGVAHVAHQVVHRGVPMDLVLRTRDGMVPRATVIGSCRAPRSVR